MSGLSTKVCPYLPEVAGDYPAGLLRQIDVSHEPEKFAATALRCAQAKWHAGLPAQAVLMLNRVFGLPGEPFAAASEMATPYRAMFWILRHGERCGYLGNPRRHFQHLATRMPQVAGRQRRVWRAWACWHLARLADPTWEADALQLAHESVAEPTSDEIHRALLAWGLPGEAEMWESVALGSEGQGTTDG